MRAWPPNSWNEQISPFLKRSTSLPSPEKVTARLRSQVRRLAKQKAHRGRLELYKGSVLDLELLAPRPRLLWMIRSSSIGFSHCSHPMGALLLKGYDWD